jgi:hypothetical protein
VVRPVKFTETLEICGDLNRIRSIAISNSVRHSGHRCTLAMYPIRIVSSCLVVHATCAVWMAMVGFARLKGDTWDNVGGAREIYLGLTERQEGVTSFANEVKRIYFSDKPDMSSEEFYGALIEQMCTKSWRGVEMAKE